MSVVGGGDWYTGQHCEDSGDNEQRGSRVGRIAETEGCSLRRGVWPLSLFLLLVPVFDD